MSSLEPFVTLGCPFFTLTVETTRDPEIDDGLQTVLERQTGVSHVSPRGDSSHTEIVYLVGLDMTLFLRIGTLTQEVIAAIEAYYVSYGKSPRIQAINDL